jgi:hypothetical protein
LDIYTALPYNWNMGTAKTSTLEVTDTMQLDPHTVLTTPVNGTFEYDGTNLYFTVGATRKTVTLV